MKKFMLCFLICMLCAFTSSAQEDGTRILPDDAAPSNGFGHTIALEGDTLVVGAPNIDVVYVFTRADSVWEQTARLTVATENVFGIDVALNGDTLVIGENGLGLASGRVHIYERNRQDWQPVKVFEMGEDRFGGSVAIDGDTIVIGDTHAWAADLALDQYYAEAGAVYTTTRIDGTWTEPTKIETPVKAIYFNFGYTVAIQDDMILAAGREFVADGEISRSGIFRLNGTVSVPQETDKGRIIPGDTFALEGDMLAVGIAIDKGGFVEVYTRSADGWTHTGTLNPDSATTTENFGQAIDISGNRIVVGADMGNSAYVFELTENGWEKIARFQNDVKRSAFGLDLAIDGNTIAVSAPYTEDSGSVYVYEPGE